MNAVVRNMNRILCCSNVFALRANTLEQQNLSFYSKRWSIFRNAVMNVDLNTACQCPMNIVVLGDTHVPSDMERISDDTMDQIRNFSPSFIFHTGDIEKPDVIQALNSIAPVFAVRGNRDILYWNHYPAICNFSFHGVKISMFHGQGNFWQYLRLKIISFFGPINPLYLLDKIPEEAKDAQIIIHGHTHFPFLWNDNKRVLLNPGSLFVESPNKEFPEPSFAVIQLFEPQRIKIEIFYKTTEWHSYCNKELDRKIFCSEER